MLRAFPRRFLSTTTLLRRDPWPGPLPFTPEHIASTTSSPSDGSPHISPLPRSDETLPVLRARLTYQSRKRGILETDLILSTFARDHLPQMSEGELRQYDKLLDEPDWDIYYWSTGKKTPPEKWASSPVLQKLKVHTSNEGKEVRVMPALGDTLR